MKKVIFLTAVFILLLLHDSKALEVANLFKESQLYFIKNNGQIIDSSGSNLNSIQFYVQQGNTITFFKDNIISFVVCHNGLCQRIDMEFLGSNRNAKVIPKEEQVSRLNFYQYNCPNGIKDVKSYKKVIYKNIYKNIDIVFYVVHEKLKYDIKVKPGGDPSNIMIKYSGFEEINISRANIKLISSHNNLIDSLPEIYQFDNGIKRIINGHYNFNNNVITFNINNYNKKKTLIIDPEIQWSTFIGGSSNEDLRATKANQDGEVIVVGSTWSIDYPTTPGAWQVSKSGSNNRDIIVSKFNESGDMIWSTYIGGSGNDNLLNVGIQNTGDIWVTGETTRGDFPITNDAFQNIYGGGSADGVILKLSTNGQLLFSSFIGGSSYDALLGLKINNLTNEVWFGGQTFSRDLKITPNAYQKNNEGVGGGYDGFIVKCSENGNLMLSSYHGGDHDESIEDITLDRDGNPVVFGWSRSSMFRYRIDGYQKSVKGIRDAYIALLNQNDGRPIKVSFLGGTENDEGYSIETDKTGNYVISGVTSSLDFSVTTSSYSTNKKGQGDYFLAKFSDSLDLIWSTYFGGSSQDGYEGEDSPQGGIDVDNLNNIAFSGFTSSTDFPVTDSAIQKTLKGSEDAFISVFSENGNLLYSTYLGGSNEDRGYDVHFDSENSLYTVGRTNSSDFPIIGNAFQSSNRGAFDGYIVKFGVPPVVEPDTCINSFTYNGFDNSSDLTLTGYSRYIDSVTRLTPTKFHTFGSMWYKNKLSIADGFITRFSFKILYGDNVSTTDNSLPGADGLAFIISNSDIKEAGCMGGGIFYDGLPNSLAIEFDTFCNDSLQIFDFKDPNGNHLAVQSNGTGLNSSTHTSENCLAMCTTIPSLKPDGTTYYVQIEYSKDLNTLKIWLDENGSFLSPSIVIQDFNLKSLLNLEDGKRAYMGIGAATGDAYAYHDVLDWYLCLMSSDKKFTSADKDEWLDNINEVFPNPVKDVALLRFTLDKTSDVVVSIHDAIGRNIKKFSLSGLDTGIQEINCNFSNFESGMYYYTISDGSKIQSGKFIVRK